MKKELNMLVAGVLTLSMCLLCVACGNTAENVEGEKGGIFKNVGNEGGLVENSNNTEITIVKTNLKCNIDDVEKSNGFYPRIILSDDIASQYPKLKEVIDDQNSYWKSDCEIAVSSAAQWAVEMEADRPYTYTISTRIVRADDRIFSILVSYFYDEGALHPNRYDESINIDPATGDVYAISDVIADTHDFAKDVRKAMTKKYPDAIEGIDSYYYGDGEVFQDKYDQDTYTWFLTDEGLTLWFSPYEIDSYAAGNYDVTLSYKDYPSLIQKIFRQTENQDLESLIVDEEGDTVYVDPAGEGYDDEHDEEEADAIMISNPTWNRYISDSVADVDASIISLTMTKEDRSDWLDSDVWTADNGFERPELPYSDGVYYYDLYSYSDYGATALLIYNADETVLLYDYDLTQLCNGPDEESGYITASEEYIRWAQIVENTLYVTVGHYGYAYEEPNNAYMIAIDLTTNELLWKSEPLVANSWNFKVYGDTIICGYGFTEEPDYIYLLNRYNGEVAETIPVASAPEQFEIRGTTLYVATYNTAYEFEIGQ